MKNLLFLFLLFINAPKNFAASIQPTRLPSDSILLIQLHSPAPKQAASTKEHKTNLLQRLQSKFLQKKLVKKIKRAVDSEKSKDTVSTLALVSGITGLVLLFVVPALGFLLMLGGIIMGIIGLNKNPNRKSRTRALIGLIAGSIGIIFVTAIIIAFATTFN